MKESPVADLPMELFADVVTVDPLIVIQPPTQAKAEFFNDATDRVRASDFKTLWQAHLAEPAAL